jgi:Tol biopolymer transport system component
MKMERGVLIALAALCFGAKTNAVEVPILRQSGTGEGTLAELRSSPHKILFEAYAEDNWDLFAMNADGSDKRNLTQTPNIHEMYPQASPDGARICFVADVQDPTFK